MKTEAWWICNVCRNRLVKVGHRFQPAIAEHRKAACGPLAGALIQQLAQGKPKHAAR